VYGDLILGGKLGELQEVSTRGEKLGRFPGE
jgi:hypothetical protein